MRSWIALSMSLLLLFVSSMPLVSFADSCLLPRHMMAMDEGMHDGMPGIGQAHLGKDMQDCRIECACGCHRSVDALPHQLAPHVLALPPFLPAMFAGVAAAGGDAYPFGFAPGVELPPPDSRLI